jgi:probable HAF family extracellular repeat protein
MRYTSASIVAVFAVLLAQSSSSPAADGRQYSLTQIPHGDLPGMGAFDMNDSGVVVGIREAFGDPQHEWRGFLWTREGGLVDLGEGPGAFAINNQGTVVGRHDDRLGSRAFVWTADTGVRLLTLPSGLSEAIAVNDAGQIVGHANGPNSARAFLREPDGTLRWLPFPSGARANGPAAIGMNNLGDVVGRLDIGDGDYHAFFWPAEGGYRDLGDLPGGLIQGAAGKINNRRQILGDALVAPDPNVPGSNGQRAVFFEPDGSIRQIGLLPGMTDSSGRDINDLGEVVGWSGKSGYTEDWRGFVWSEQEGMRDLNDLLDASVQGWTLVEPMAINNTGQILVHGTYNGQPATALLTPVPAPSAVGAACGIMAMAFFSGRQRRRL